MPEWNVQRICRVVKKTNSYNSQLGVYFLISHDETWTTFDLRGKIIECKVNAILNPQGNLVSIIDQKLLLNCDEMKVFPSDITGYGDSNEWSNQTNVFLISKEFVKEYGLRSGEYLDFVILGVRRTLAADEDVEPVYPKRFMNGIIQIQPSGSEPISQQRISEPLIDHSLGEFYDELIDEINLTHAYGLHRSTSILLRKLFETLLIELLRIKFGSQRIDLYYNEKKHQFRGFYNLIKNLKSVQNEFNPITSGLDGNFFEFLEKFRETANSNVHNLESYFDKSLLENDKEKMNHIILVIKNAITKIKSL